MCSSDLTGRPPAARRAARAAAARAPLALDLEAGAPREHPAHRAGAGRALRQGGRGDGLANLEITAFFALIDVCRHRGILVVADVGARRQPPGEELGDEVRGLWGRFKGWLGTWQGKPRK